MENEDEDEDEEVKEKEHRLDRLDFEEDDELEKEEKNKNDVMKQINESLVERDDNVIRIRKYGEMVMIKDVKRNLKKIIKKIDQSKLQRFSRSDGLAASCRR